MTPATLLRSFAILAAGAIGGLAFTLIGLPAPWLSGAVVGSAVAAMAGLRAAVPDAIREPTNVLIGLSMGAAVTPETLAQAATWPISLLGLAVAIIGTTAASFLVLNRIFGMDRPTSFYAAAPGALSYVILVGPPDGADPVRIVVVQVLRLFVLVTVLPSVAAGFGPEAAAAPLTPVDFAGLAILAVPCAAAGFLAWRLGVPGGALVGAMLMSGVLFGSGLIASGVPDLLVGVGFVVLGASIGARFGGMRVGLILQFVLAGLASLLASSVVALACAWIVAAITGLPVIQVFMAYAPGGLEAMTLIALALAIDPAFVGVHHLARVFALSFFLPLAAIPVLGKRRKRIGPPPPPDGTAPP